jgi:hypothetical protein
MDFTGLTGEEIIDFYRKYNEDIIRKYTEFEEQLEEEKEQERKEKEQWEIFKNENPNVYNDYVIEEEDLQDGKYIFIF